ncbi:family 1 glycosylhydrolase [Candidatus Parcubacteria bacterium]|nr:family 1 glycosylhydrolase [Patescibacteria group bacterium]MBU4381250.1 family 1 glycosylhydrolase [Patescibacteria group bacterium]MCG2689282.1 family 1 glycosylhydrolase [Candidatus Parcubacteria bacterium]
MKRNDFPSSFLFGAATSAHQIEGEWGSDWHYAEASGRVPAVGIACDHRRYRKIFKSG